MVEETVYIKVPVADFKIPASWTNTDMEDPDWFQEEFFAVGNHRTMVTVYSEKCLEGVTHVLVEVSLSELKNK